MNDHQSSEGAGREAGSLPLGFRSRARRLYRARRKALMEVPVEVLRDRFGSSVDYDDEFHQTAGVTLDDVEIQVAFAGHYRMFGALIDTQWVGRTGEIEETHVELRYRFDKHEFRVRKGTDDGLAEQLSTKRVDSLAKASELKELLVADDGSNRRVTLTPLPGTITAVYFPPLPPYSVPLKKREAKAQLELLLHLLRA